MMDNETQKEVQNETVEPTKALEISIQMEMGAQNQQKEQNLAPSTNSVNAVNNFQTRNHNASYQPARKDFTRYPSVPQNYQYTSVCTNCGQRWSHNHHQTCPANGRKCNNCGIMGHFARKRRTSKISQGQTPEPPQTNANQIVKTAKKSDYEEFVEFITSYQQLYEQVYDSNYMTLKCKNSV